MHRVASLGLRSLLERYESLTSGMVCHLLDWMLLEEFRSEKHCLELVLSNSLIRDIVVFCRTSTRDVVGDDVAAQEAQRLRAVGEKLFAATFVMHTGFLPLNEEEPRKEGQAPKPQTSDAAPEDKECPWDTGDLDLPLLQHTPATEEALHLARRVLLRGLFRRQRAGVENDVPTTVRYWPLGQWNQCRDVAQISEAFTFVTNCWRDLQAAKAASRWSDAEADPSVGTRWVEDEESLFCIFSELELKSLQP